MKSLLPMLILLLCCSCSSCPIFGPSNSSLCQDAKDKLLQLQCMDEGRLLGGPTKHGVPFEQFCQDMIDKGVMQPDQIKCLANITECEQVNDTCK